MLVVLVMILEEFALTIKIASKNRARLLCTLMVYTLNEGSSVCVKHVCINYAGSGFVLFFSSNYFQTLLIALVH